MSIECGECEHDLRGGHADECSRHPARKAFQHHYNGNDLSRDETSGEFLDATIRAHWQTWIAAWRAARKHYED